MATTEVSQVLHEVDSVFEANVYGVTLPGKVVRPCCLDRYSCIRTKRVSFLFI